MKEERYYYSLTFRGSSKYHKSHDSKKNSNEPLTIGETPDCEIRYEQLAPAYEPEYYATILPNEDGKSWRIVKRSPHIDVNIAGIGGFSYVYNLQDGDKISFEGQKQELEFKIHHDENYGGGIEDKHSHFMANTVIAISILFPLIITFIFALGRRSGDVSEDNLSEYKQDIYKIQVDSVQKVRIAGGDTIVLITKDLVGDKPTGTAFLTKDSMLITARHCVEYWLGEDVSPDMEIAELDSNDIRLMAAEVETYNYTHQGSRIKLALRSYFSLYGKDDTVHVNSLDTQRVRKYDEYDDFLVIDDFVHRYYWRTITPYYINRKMELGDVMYVKMDKAGKIECADFNDMKKMKSDTSLGFYGYPESENGNELRFQRGRLNRDFKEGQILVQNSDLTYGNSGGPVFAKCGGSCKVIGIVSKVDKINGNLTMSVPITVIQKGEKK